MYIYTHTDITKPKSSLFILLIAYWIAYLI